MIEQELLCLTEINTIMKGKLFLLLGIGFVPLALTGQTYLYNKGTMSVVTTNNQNTALYIGGDLRSEVTGEITLTRAKVVLTGDLYRYGTAASTTSHVFNVGNYATYGTAAGQSFLYFKGGAAQHIWATAGSASRMNFDEKANNAIYFPNIVIDNSKHVTIHPEIGASAYNVKPIKGRLILESRKLASTDELPTGGSTIHNDKSSSVLAHLLVKGVHDSSESFSKESDVIKPSLDEYGGVQVNLALEKVASNSNDRVSGDPIVGMGSPFRRMRADYFMWNFLFLPSGNNIFNEDNNTTTDPTTVLEAGRGFVVGIDLRGHNGSVYDDIHPFYTNNNNGYSIDFNTRAKDGYKFNRFAYGVNRNNLYQVSSTYTSTTPTNPEAQGKNIRPSDSSSTKDAYSAEVLNSGDITRTLVKGFNYLSNPYTCPLDVSKLVFVNDVLNPSQDTDWKVAPGYTTRTSGTTTIVRGDIANRVWVMDPSSVASGTFNIFNGGTADNPGNKWVEVHTVYKLISHIGATATTDYDDGSGVLPDGVGRNALIAPMQMFVVFANNSKNITIPANQRKIDDNALFLRSEGTKKYESDDFLFEVEDLDKGTTDRTAVVLRTFSEINKTGYLDIKKLTTDVSSNEDGKTKAVTSEGTTPKTTAMSALYTQDSDGNALETRFLS